MTAMTARLERVATARARRPGRAPPGWTEGAPWAGLVAVAVAVALWVAVVAGVALPLGAWLARVDPARAVEPGAPTSAGSARAG